MSRSNKLFKDINVNNKVSRNGFDLSHNVKFTAKCGELLPLWHRHVMFGDNFKVSVDSFTRTRPVQTAAFTEIMEYFDFFFIPYRLLGKQIPHILAQDKSNPVIANSNTQNASVGQNLPRMTLGNMRKYYSQGTSVPYFLNSFRTNEFGFNRGLLSNKLLNHLGYCWLSDRDYCKTAGIDYTSPDKPASSGILPVNIDSFSINPYVSLLPLAAYQKVYYDYYRNTQWEDNQPYLYNFDYMGNEALFSVPSAISDYWNNPTLFDMRFANYPKDLFFGLYPDSQFGDTATVDISNEVIGDGKVNVTSNDVNTELSLISTSANSFQLQGPDAETGNILSVDFTNVINNLQSSFDILEFRKARFVQKYKEIMGTGQKNYKSIIQKIFNVDIPDTLTDECQFLGGHSQKISISEVENTNITGGNLAVQAGKGIGSGKSSLIEFTAKEAGIIMCIYHACPVIDYALNAFHFDVVKTHVDDFPNPVFDKLGLQEMPTYFLDNSVKLNVSASPFLGWTTRYFDSKTDIDKVLGYFRADENEVNLSDWVAPLTPELIFDYMLVDSSGNPLTQGVSVDYRFFKVNPRILDKIFDVNVNSLCETDQLRVSTHFQIHAVRNLDYLGIPNA